MRAPRNVQRAACCSHGHGARPSPFISLLPARRWHGSNLALALVAVWPEDANHAADDELCRPSGARPQRLWTMLGDVTNLANIIMPADDDARDRRS